MLLSLDEIKIFKVTGTHYLLLLIGIRLAGGKHTRIVGGNATTCRCSSSPPLSPLLSTSTRLSSSPSAEFSLLRHPPTPTTPPPLFLLSLRFRQDVTGERLPLPDYKEHASKWLKKWLKHTCANKLKHKKRIQFSNKALNSTHVQYCVDCLSTLLYFNTAHVLHMYY